MQAGACSKAPRNCRRPVSANDRMARLTPPCRTASTVSQPGSASSLSSAPATRSSRGVDGLPAEEPLLAGDHAAEHAEEGGLQLVLGDVREPPGGDLAQLRPVLHGRPRAGDQPRRLDRARQAAGDDAVDARPLQRRAGRLGLAAAPGREWHVVGRQRPAVLVEVGDLGVAQQVDPAPAQRRPPRRSGSEGSTVSSDRAARTSRATWRPPGSRPAPWFMSHASPVGRAAGRRWWCWG
jgi:hypothetical protein